jgi:hypothetical protein
MAKVEFTNIYKEKVLDNVQKLIKQTIPGIPLYYDEHRGQESFLLRPISDTFIDYASNAHIRTYITEIISGSDYTRDKDIIRMTDIAELLKRIFFDNRDLELNNITEWYNAKVTDVIYERDEEDIEKERFILTLECNVNEVV